MDKECSKCLIIKDVSLFYVTRTGKVGGYCQACRELQKALYRVSHAKEIQQTIKKWQQAHPDKGAAYTKKWRDTHPEEAKQATSRWRSKNPDKHTLNQSRYQKTNRIRLSKREMQRYRADSSKVLTKNHVYRARKAQAPIIERVDPAIIFKRDKGICHICHTRV